MKWNVLAPFSSKEKIIDVLLENRGIKTREEKAAFLNPQDPEDVLKTFPAEFHSSLMLAGDIVRESIKSGHMIVIHGDYDSDGICASAILYRAIKNELGHKDVRVFIPNRFDHGYGVSSESVNAIAEQVSNPSTTLLITVDTGITSVEAISYAKELGFKIILTDHHQKPSVLPAADAIVWSDQMVGSGVSWALAHELSSKDKRLVALAALATVTDLQPLFGFNRSIVKAGLRILNSDPFPGIKALYSVSGRKGEIGTYDLGWVLGPRLNATGRIGSAETGFKLLTEDDQETCEKYAEDLNNLNIERQSKTLEMYNLANNLQGSGKPRVLVSASKDYHEGIIGLVAAKLVQEHYRPAVVIGLNDEYGKGSVRSVSGVDIIAFLRQFEDVFENVGGHPMAAGFTVRLNRLDDLLQNIEKFAESYVLDEHLIPVLNIDLEIPMEIIDLEFVEDLEKLKPFGIGNKEPLFMSKNVGLVGFDKVGKNREHLSLRLLAGGRSYKAIWFNGVEKAPEMLVGDRLEIVYSVERKEYNGRTYLDLIVKDISL